MHISLSRCFAVWVTGPTWGAGGQQATIRAGSSVCAKCSRVELRSGGGRRSAGCGRRVCRASDALVRIWLHRWMREDSAVSARGDAFDWETDDG